MTTSQALDTSPESCQLLVRLVNWKHILQMCQCCGTCNILKTKGMHLVSPFLLQQGYTSVPDFFFCSRLSVLSFEIIKSVQNNYLHQANQWIMDSRNEQGQTPVEMGFFLFVGTMQYRRQLKRTVLNSCCQYFGSLVPTALDLSV